MQFTIDDDDEPAIPQADAAALTLGERFHTLMAPTSPKAFAPGAMVIYKTGFDPRRAELKHLPIVVVGGNPDAYDRAINCNHIGRGDIVTMELVRDGTCTFECIDSRVLEPWPRTVVGGEAS